MIQIIKTNLLSDKIVYYFKQTNRRDPLWRYKNINPSSPDMFNKLKMLITVMDGSSTSAIRIIFTPDLDNILEASLSADWQLNELAPLPKELIDELNSYLLFI